MRPALRHRFLSEPTGVRIDLTFPPRKLLAGGAGVESVDVQAFSDARTAFTNDPHTGAAMFEELGYRVQLTDPSLPEAPVEAWKPGPGLIRFWILAMTLAGALPMLGKITGIIELQPEPLTMAVNRAAPEQIAAWLFLAAAAVWGVFSICRYISASAVASFMGRTWLPRTASVLSVCAFAAGMAAQNLLYGTLIAACLAFAAGGTGVERKRVDRTHE